MWNQRTKIHRNSSFYNVDSFLKGEEALTPIELSELGNVTGKSMLHLQCHFGLDTLAWARHGALVTGLDFSTEAIAEAEQLKEQAALTAEFVCCNVYDATKFLQERQFDIVFTSYGVIGWLPDLERWAAIIRRHLKPGGIFYMAEFHPVLWMFDEEFSKIEYPYRNVDVIVQDSQQTYTEGRPTIEGKEYSWNHSLAEVLNALIQHGLQIRQFNEFPYSPYPCFNNMVLVDKGKWNIKGLEGKLPMVYSVLAAG